jgi:NAD(P)-dependent dehydrogenase (short-subunit alcohol dehydrogenase family)
MPATFNFNPRLLREMSETRSLTGSVVVLGATGGIGREIVPALISAGYPVIAVGRDRARLAALAERTGVPERLVTVTGSVADDAEAALLAGKVRGLKKRIATVIASLRGPMASARLLDQPASFLRQTLDENLMIHFIAAKHFLPILAESHPGGLYLLLGGPAADISWAGYGHVSITAAAQKMLARVLREEAKDLPVTVRMLQTGTPVRTENNLRCSCPDWISADEVARHVVKMIEAGEAGELVVRVGSYTGCVRQAGNKLSVPSPLMGEGEDGGDHQAPFTPHPGPLPQGERGSQ